MERPLSSSPRLTEGSDPPAGDLPSAPSMLNGGDIYAFPLSFAQQRIWRACRAQPNSPAYNGSFRMNLAGPLDPQLLERSFNEIIRRHEILRATIEEIDGHPAQVIAPALTIRVGVIDLRKIPGERREGELDRLCTLEAQQPFDLHHGPLIRIGLIQMEDQRHVLTLTVHQLICDGWSIGLIMEELQKIHTAFFENSPSPLPPIPLQFADYVVWQQEMVRQPSIDKQLRYWKRKLRRYHRLEIAPDIAEANRESSDAAIISHLLPRSLTDQLKDFSNKQGGTFFITTLAAFFAFLCRLTGLRDLAVGAPLAGRNIPELEGLIGQFVNHIVFRAGLEGDLEFEEILPLVRETVWEAFSNQDIPFENVISAVVPAADLAENPFFLINFICQREYGRASTFHFDFAGIRMSTMPSKSQGALYDMNFFLVEREVGWRMSLEYKTRLFTGKTAEAILDNFKRVFEAIAQNPKIRLSELPLRDLPEHLKRNAASADTAADLYAMPASLVQQRFWLLSQIERNNPSFHMAAAVRITGSLDVRHLEQSFESIVSRHETLRTTFEEIDKAIVQVISPTKPFRLPIMDLRAVPESEREQRLSARIQEESRKTFDLTKGPLFRAVLFLLSENDSVLLTTIHHILADGWSNRVLQEDLWLAYDQLSQGRQPSFSPLPIQYSDYATWLADWLDSPEAKEHLEFWSRQLEGELPVANFPTDRRPTPHPASQGAIETLLLSPELAQSLKDFARTQNITLFTVLLTGFAVLLSRSSSQTDIIVGAPVANRRDETEHLIGPLAGPLCLRLDLSGSPNLRDLSRRVYEVNLNALSHAELPFEVLVDRIKMHTVNGRKPIFQFYFYYQNAFLQPRQVGLLTITPLPTFSLGIPFELQLGMIERAEGIRAQLEYNPDLFNAGTIRQVLLDYQRILERIVSELDLALEAITVSCTASPTSSSEHLAARREFVPPQTETEQRLANIWEEVLSTRPVGRNQDYFELGGSSLLAVRLLAEIERVFHIHLPISTLLYAKTVADFARLLENQEAQDSWSPVVPIQPHGSRIPFFCIHGGGGNVLIYRHLSHYLGPDQPVYGLQSQGLDGKRPFLKTIEEMATLYADEIRKVQPHGPYYLGGYCLGGTIALEIAQRIRARGEQVALVAFFDTVNWARLRPRNSIDWWRYHIERILFHFQNFLLLDFRGKRKFLTEKWKALESRTPIWTGSLLSTLNRNRADSTSQPQLLARIWNVNDQASVGYRPKPYFGRISDFRPKNQYSAYLEPEVNWDGIAMGRFDVTYLPVYPAGMLLEPFVKDLAAGLRAAIERANEDS